MRRRIYLFMLLFVSCVIMCCADVFSETFFSGWNNIDGNYCYLDNEGRMILFAWKESDGEKYFLGEDGFVVKNQLVEYNGYLYFVDEEGRQVRDRMVTIDDTTNPKHLFNNGTYYFGKDGRAFVKQGGTNFSVKIDGKDFAFDENGLLYVGWLDADGNPLSDESSILEDGVYHTTEEGVVQKNEWYDFSKDIALYSTTVENAELNSEDFINKEKYWMYFDSNGKKVKSNIEEDNAKVISKNINDKMYSFDEFGIMLSGFEKNKALNTDQPSNPSLTGEIRLYDEESGELLKNKWYKTVPSKPLDEVKYEDNEENWYRTNGSGKVLNNRIKEIDGKKYIFDGQGKLRTGFCIADSNAFFISSFKAEDLTKEDFIYSIDEGSILYGIELGEFRYFGDNDDESHMRTGKQFIKIDGEEYEFLFKDNGRAFGDQSNMVVHKNCYYINGLKLKPWENNAYGILKLSNGQYIILDKKGKKVKKTKALLKDNYDSYLVMIDSKLVAYVPKPESGISIKWKKKNSDNVPEDGYYLYDKDTKKYTLIADINTPALTDFTNVPKEMYINFK